MIECMSKLSKAYESFVWCATLGGIALDQIAPYYVSRVSGAAYVRTALSVNPAARQTRMAEVIGGFRPGSLLVRTIATYAQ
jgi:hypothetical protein